MTDHPSFTAIHEAGHFVAHVRLLSSSHRMNISIVADHETASLGRARFEEESTDDTTAQRHDVVVSCAGYAASVLFGEDMAVARAGAELDFDNAQEVIDRWCLPPLEEHLAMAFALMDEPRNRAAVERIAHELDARAEISAEEAEILVDVADGDATEQDYLTFRALMRR